MTEQKQSWPNTGALFKNEKKKTPESPDYMGSLDVDGNKFTIFGRLTRAPSGKTYMRLSIAPPLEQTKQPPQPMRQADPDPFIDDELPPF